MAKRNNWDKKKHYKSRTNKSSELIISEIHNPLADVSIEEFEQIYLKISQSSTVKFNEALAKLKTTIASVDPFHLLSVLSNYGLTNGLSDSGERAKKDADFTISQSHVEIIQALVLQIPEGKISKIPAKSQQIQVFFDLLPQLSIAFAWKRLEQITKAKTRKEKFILKFQEHLRLNTQFVRNWGYFQRVIEITKRLYQPLDSYYRDSIGLEATSLISIFQYFVKETETKLNNYFHQIRYIFSKNNVEDAIKAYYDVFPDLQDRPDDLTDFCHKNNLSLENIKFLILEHSALRLPDIFSFYCPKIAKDLNIENTKGIKTALSKLSYKLGDLKENNSEFFFLDNPIWTKSLIQVSEDLYFSSIPQVFFSFIFQIFEELSKYQPQFKEKLSKQRAVFVENEIEKLMKKAFPESIIQSNFKWQEYETDLLVKIDSFLLIVEAKSGSISSPAFRGATKAMKRDIKELLEYPAIQSTRLADKIWRIKQGREKDDDFLANLQFDLEQIQKIIRLSITLEDFATIQSNLCSLQETGWLSEDVSTAVTMTLADLEVVFDILDSAPDKIHYLVRRSELQEIVKYRADELDLIGLYTETTFNFGEAEFHDHQWIYTGMSEKIDDYYIAKEHNYNNANNVKPKIKLTKWWSDIRNYIESRKPYRWSEVAVMMLNVPFAEQITLEKKFKKLTKKLRNSKYKKDENNSIIFHPHKGRNEAFALVALREFQERERHQIMENIAKHSFTFDYIDRCLVLAISIAHKDYPYSSLAVFEKN